MAAIGNGNGPALVAGGVCQTPGYLSGQKKEAVQAIFKKQLDVFIDNDVDFLLAEVKPTNDCILLLETY